MVSNYIIRPYEQMMFEHYENKIMMKEHGNICLRSSSAHLRTIDK